MLSRMSLFAAAAFVILLKLLTSPSAIAQQRVPRFERSECSFVPPPAAAGLRRKCGYLVVPQVREKPNGRTLRLAVVIYRAKENASAPPLLLLHGGPGGAGGVGSRWPFFQSPLTRNRDLVIYDVRGAGRSEPQLCPGWYENTAPVFNRRTRQDREQAYDEAVRACAATLKAQGIDPTAYSTAINAADLINLRRALGYAKWDIYGVSYGSTLAQELMRRDTAATHAVVLMIPGRISSGAAEDAFTQQQALERVFTACSADDACHTAFPDVENDFYAVVDELTQRPMEVRIEGNKQPATVWLDGERFVREIRDQLNSIGAASLPLLISEMRRGDRAAAAHRLLGDGLMEPWYPLGHLVECNDSGADYPAVVAAVKQKLRPAFQAIADDIRAHCEGWVSRPARSKRAHLASDIPTLIMDGEIDPRSTDSNAQKIAIGLKHAYVYTVRGRGHESLGPCADSVVERFLEDPTRAPDASCIASVRTVAFITRKAQAPLALVISPSGDAQTPFAGQWNADVPLPLGVSFAIELKTDGAALTGIIRRLPSGPEPIQIFDGKLNGKTITFKFKSPDGLRTITFTGTLTGDEIMFHRQVEHQGLTPRPTPGFFGTAFPQTFTARRTTKRSQQK